jgi:DNA segregation ATPase FtsK/SpoIIIE-like protein
MPCTTHLAAAPISKQNSLVFARVFQPESGRPEKLETDGVVSAANHVGKREVLAPKVDYAA